MNFQFNNLKEKILKHYLILINISDLLNHKNISRIEGGFNRINEELPEFPLQSRI